MKNILVTGGAGYIGSHICLNLLESGPSPAAVNNLTNGHREPMPAEEIFVEGDTRNYFHADDLHGGIFTHLVMLMLSLKGISLILTKWQGVDLQLLKFLNVVKAIAQKAKQISNWIPRLDSIKESIKHTWTFLERQSQ